MAGPIRERLRSLERRELVGIGLMAVLLASGAGVWYLRSLPRPIEIRTGEGGPVEPGGTSARSSPSPSPSPILVHVAGWVARPGVYQLYQGDRVIDAIERAGGARAGADLRSVNLAALLTDAQQILVTKVIGSGGGSQTGFPGGAGEAGAGGAGSLLNVNTATVEQLETLPGIGDVLAQRILEYREEHGPFRSIDDLLNVSGIGEARLADLRSEVTV